MQDIHSILTSLHAMEADLVPATSAATNELHSPFVSHEQHTRQLLSAPARNGVPTCDVPIPWDKFYTQDNYNTTEWNKLPHWDRYPVFLKFYDKHQSEQQKKLESAVKNTASATTTAANIFEAQKQIKHDYETTSKHCRLLLQTAQKLDLDIITTQLQENANTIKKEYPSIKTHFDNTKQKYGTSIDTYIQDLQIQMKAAVEEQNISQALYDLDEKRHQVFLDIVKTQKDKKPGTTINKFKPEQIAVAEAQKDPALRTFEKSQSALEATKTEITSTKTLQSKANAAKNLYDRSVEVVTDIIQQLAALMPAITKAAEAAAAAGPPPSADADAPSPVQAPQQEMLHLVSLVAQLDHNVKVQEEIREEADDAAAAEMQQQAALLRTHERAVIAESVELSVTQLQETQAASAVNEKSASRIVALHETRVEMLQSAVELAEKDVEETVQEQDAVNSTAASSAEPGMFVNAIHTIRDILFAHEQNAAHQKIDAAAAASTLQAARNEQNKQHMDAYTAAESCTEQCQQAANAACAHAKTEILVYADMIVAKMKIDQKMKELEAVRANCMEHIQLIEKRKKLNDVSDEEYGPIIEKTQKRLADIKKHQENLRLQDTQNNDNQAVQEDIYHASFELYDKSKKTFTAAQHAQREAWAKLPVDERVVIPKALKINDLPKQYVQAMIKKRAHETFPEGLDTPNTDIDQLAAQKVDEWQLKMDKNGQDLAMLQKLESEFQAMQRAQECVARANALRTSLLKEIEKYCTCAIEIETMKKEQPTDQDTKIAHQRLLVEAQSEESRLNKLLHDTGTKLANETASANEAIDELVRVTTDNSEIISLKAMKIVPVHARDIIDDRLSSMRAHRNTAAAAAPEAKGRAVSTANENATAEKQKAYEQALPGAVAALKLARETNAAMPALCEELAVLLLNDTNIKAKIKYFADFHKDSHVPNIPEMLDRCKQAEQENDTQLQSTQKRVEVAKAANKKAVAAAHKCVTAIINLTWNNETYTLWLNSEHTPPDEFEWENKLAQNKKYQNKIRDDNMRIKSDAFSRCLKKLNGQELEMTQLMTKVLELDEIFFAAEIVYKDTEAVFNATNNDANREDMASALQKFQNADHDRRPVHKAENENINECAATTKQAIADGNTLLPLTLDGLDFQNVWETLRKLNETNYTIQRDKIKLKRGQAAELKRNLDARRTLIGDAVPLQAALDAINSQMNACLKNVCDHFNSLMQKKPVTLYDREVYRPQKKKFDDLLEELRLHVEAYNAAGDAWLEHARNICRCMGIGYNDDIQKQWLAKCSYFRRVYFNTLLADRKIVVSSILDLAPETQMAQPPQNSVPVPQVAPQVPAPPQKPIVLPQPLPYPEILEPASQSPSSHKVVVHPSDPSHDSDRYWHEPHDSGPRYDYTGPSNHTASSAPPCSFKHIMLAFAARLLPLVYPPTPVPHWLARPAVARYAHPDRARTAGGSLELHALCARIAHIALLTHIDDNHEPLAAHRLVVEVPEHSRLLLRAVAPLPVPALYAARAASSREHRNAAAIRECLSRSSLDTIRACAAATVAAATQNDDGDFDAPINQSSQQYV